MNDPIDRQAVLHALKDAFGKYEDKVDIEVELITSVLKIPSANLQPTCNKLATDCISRQAAIECLEHLSACDEPFVEIGTDDETFIGKYEAITEISDLSPAQPYTEAEIQKMQDLYQAEIDKAFELGQEDARSEIIHCGECKHRDPEDKKCDCGHDILWQLPREDEWYCADAERRTDEAD